MGLEELISDVFSWMAQIPPLWAYASILVIAYGENVVPPIPGDMVVVFGGYLAAVGDLNLVVVILLSTIGGALGFMTMYAIGYRVGNAVFDPDRLKWLPKRKIGRVRDWLNRWGFGVVAANRFLSGARSVISLTVGMAHTHPLKTAVFATLSAAVWTALIAYAGFAVGENWEVIGEYLRRYGQVVLVLFAAAGLGWLGWYLIRRRKRQS